MNTRLQVEHPVTEMVCNVDLVREQIRIAAGEPLGYAQVGHRASAATPSSAASTPRTRRPSCPRPAGSTVYQPPGGLGVRVDSALYAGYVVPPYYDSMVAKLIVHAPTRAEAIARMRRALTRIRDPGHRDHAAAAPPHHGGARLPRRRLHDPLAGAVRGAQ